MPEQRHTSSEKVTRGHGFLERPLSDLRARKANSLIPDSARAGRILDVGCGTYPLFLLNTTFAERFGIDQGVQPGRTHPGVELQQHDLNAQDRLPFQDDFFDVVTLLAVLEHIDRSVVKRLFPDVYRVLRPGGRLVMTTPAPWADSLLRVMARAGLVSAEEIEEHKELRSRSDIAALLTDAGFTREGIASGTFELGANLWVCATKHS